MPKQVANRREDKRQVLPKSLSAEIEFEGPDGGRHRLPLTEVSAVGAAFTMPYRIAGIETGAMLPDASIRLGQLVIQGNLAVLHTTRLSGSAYSCGVQFYPKSEEDRNQLSTLVSRLETLLHLSS